MDEKTSNGSSRSTVINKSEPILNTMSVYSNNYDFSLIQEKSNEISMKSKLLEKLQLEGCIVIEIL